MAEEGYKVALNVYDLSQGLARQLSTTFLGKPIEGIWHTGVVVYGYEYYFGGGIQSAPAGTTPYGTPIRVVDLGFTHVPKDVFEMYLQEIGPRYTAETYSLLTHNCNNFSNEVAQFLVGASIPDYILNLPNEVMSSPMGALILPMIQQLETTLRAGAVPQAPQFRPSTVAQSNQTASAIKLTRAGYAQSTQTKDEDVDEKPRTESSRNVDQQSDMRTIPIEGGTQEKPSDNAVAGDPLGDARNRVQEEISSEFAAIMATGTLRASEAAALATRRVMQRYGHMNTAQS
ncbi:desumoylating isopeptidase 1 [Sesamum indicum]|uniref:Desumoylating isopeptidase 1 n=1 Tax=Sesamum indicum TaxID=4182 RepID=A0A6I9TCA0_SESIN|nr:desumoylating isopeptidase 1 [Sesamum indicum]XP_011080187.1 desumoylating isopeptidase 1 [Sesamum indicum]XP_011080188.1 desumoylating isopeptidase 1 [Sesamum indicum]